MELNCLRLSEAAAQLSDSFFYARDFWVRLAKIAETHRRLDVKSDQTSMELSGAFAIRTVLCEEPHPIVG